MITESVLTSVDVLYIDYGNAENRELSHLRPLPLQFTTLPAQAVYCALAKVSIKSYLIGFRLPRGTFHCCR